MKQSFLRAAAVIAAMTVPTGAAFAQNTSTTTRQNENGVIPGPRPDHLPHFFNIHGTHDGIVIDGNARFMIIEDGLTHVTPSSLGYDNIPGLFFTNSLESDPFTGVISRGATKLYLEPGQHYTIVLHEQPVSYDTQVTPYVGYNPDTVQTISFTFTPGDFNVDSRLNSQDVVDFMEFYDTQDPNVYVQDLGFEGPQAVDYNDDGVHNDQDMVAFMNDFGL